jgi:hypothetical protein
VGFVIAMKSFLHIHSLSPQYNGRGTNNGQSYEIPFTLPGETCIPKTGIRKGKTVFALETTLIFQIAILEKSFERLFEILQSSLRSTLRHFVHPWEFCFFKQIQTTVEFKISRSFLTIRLSLLCLMQAPIVGKSGNSGIFKEKRPLFIVWVKFSFEALVNSHVANSDCLYAKHTQ